MGRPVYAPLYRWPDGKPSQGNGGADFRRMVQNYLYGRATVKRSTPGWGKVLRLVRVKTNSCSPEHDEF